MRKLNVLWANHSSVGLSVPGIGNVCIIEDFRPSTINVILPLAKARGELQILKQISDLPGMVTLFPGRLRITSDESEAPPYRLLCTTEIKTLFHRPGEVLRYTAPTRGHDGPFSMIHIYPISPSM